MHDEQNFAKYGTSQRILGPDDFARMNRFHAPLAEWGLSHVRWEARWTVLDVGCGGGANIARMLKLCPEGKVYGIDVSDESVDFARKHNCTSLDRRCFISQGNVCWLCLMPTGSLMG